MLTPDPLAELERMARAAAPEPWKTGARRQVIGPYGVCVDTDIGPKVLFAGNYNFIEKDERNAAFVAAADPATVLAMIARIGELEQDLVGAFVRTGELEYEVDEASEAPPILGAAELVAGNRYWARHGPNMKWALIDVSNVEGIEYRMKNWQFVGPVIPPVA